MAGNVGLRSEVYRDQFGVLLEDKPRKLLELDWLDSTAAMSEEQFRSWLSRFAGEAEARRPSFLLIDVRQFRHRPGDDFGAWRDTNIVPHYNRAGVSKFAMLVPSDASGWMAPGRPPAAEPPGTFPTGYFSEQAQIDAWFARS